MNLYPQESLPFAMVVLNENGTVTLQSNIPNRVLLLGLLEMGKLLTQGKTDQQKAVKVIEGNGQTDRLLRP